MDRRREELMAAALELFGRRDAERVSIEDVASAAGASRALVYHYFGGKRELYAAALKDAAGELEARLQPRRDGRPLEELACGLSRYFDFVEERAAGFAALLKGGPADHDGEAGEIVDGVRRRLFQLVVGHLRVGAPSPALRVVLRSWIASVETVALDWLEHRDIERSVLERMLVDQMVAMLGAEAKRDPQVGRLLGALVGDRDP